MLSWTENPGLVPITVVKVVEDKGSRVPLSREEQRIRRLLSLLESAILSPADKRELKGLMVEFADKLQDILARESMHERCCLDIPPECDIRVVCAFNGCLSRRSPFRSGDVWEDTLVRNASGHGPRIMPRHAPKF